MPVLHRRYRLGDPASLIADAILGSSFLSRLRKWRNWQTRKPQELVPHKGVGVRIPPSAPLLEPLTTGFN